MKRDVDDQNFIRFLTVNCEKRRQLLNLDHPKRQCLDFLRQALTNHDSKCFGYVVMPDHVHVLIWLPVGRELSKFLHSWKRGSSRFIRQWYRDQEHLYFMQHLQDEPFWQESCYPFEIENEQKLREKLQYMHENPVRRGLVSKATDWPWSSARWYEYQEEGYIPVDQLDL